MFFAVSEGRTRIAAKLRVQMEFRIQMGSSYVRMFDFQSIVLRFSGSDSHLVNFPVDLKYSGGASNSVSSSLWFTEFVPQSMMQDPTVAESNGAFRISSSASDYLDALYARAELEEAEELRLRDLQNKKRRRKSQPVSAPANVTPSVGLVPDATTTDNATMHAPTEDLKRYAFRTRRGHTQLQPPSERNARAASGERHVAERSPEPLLPVEVPLDDSVNPPVRVKTESSDRSIAEPLAHDIYHKTHHSARPVHALDQDSRVDYMAERSTNSKTEVNCKRSGGSPSAHTGIKRSPSPGPSGSTPASLTDTSLHRVVLSTGNGPSLAFHDGKPSSYDRSEPHHAAYSDTDIASFETSPEPANKRRRFNLSTGNRQLLWGVADEHTMHPPTELQREDGEDNSLSDLTEADSFEKGLNSNEDTKSLNSFPPPPSLLRLAQDLSPSPSRSSSRESSLTPLPPDLPDGPHCSHCHSTKSSNGSWCTSKLGGDGKLCNACHNYEKKNGRRRPQSLLLRAQQPSTPPAKRRRQAK
ncbi:hypothetical protein FB451DRAFT_313934 [Mycena latifolia]|nr:hypothetical protein FB451DRAFT_313934 [Mycena latifolia]